MKSLLISFVKYLKMNYRNIRSRLIRNSVNLMGEKIDKDKITLEWWNGATNLGDALAPIIVNWMLRGKEDLSNTKKRVHLLTIGSLIGGGKFDAVVWGTGIMDSTNFTRMVKNSHFVKYDIRALRGPITKDFLYTAGYNVNDIALGDPGILMPLIYSPETSNKKYKYSVIYHLMDDKKIEDERFHYINIKTDDYRNFIDEIVSSEIVISASLHGIILAEAYGIPAIFLNKEVSSQIFKYIDWYFSTGRYNIKMAESLDEAIELTPMDLPVLDEMQQELIRTFPYDLWNRLV